MYNRLLNFLNKSNILIQNRFCFRENHSTFMALLKLVGDISEELNDKDNSIGIFIDLSNAFDIIDHKLLIKKHFHYGVRGNVFDWFISYLQNRKQHVNINSMDSYILDINVVFHKILF